MLRYLLAVAVGLSLVSVSQAQVYITYDASPTVGLAGYTTWTLKASTYDGRKIVGFDFASQPYYGFGFFGPMNQVNPAGVPTIFQDANIFFWYVGADVSQDSQFLFNTSAVVVPAGFASESSRELRAVIYSETSLGTTNVPFVQVVIPDDSVVSFHGTVTVSQRGDFYDVPVRGIWPIPEPATFSLVGMACIGLVGMRRRSK